MEKKGDEKKMMEDRTIDKILRNKFKFEKLKMAGKNKQNRKKWKICLKKDKQVTIRREKWQGKKVELFLTKSEKKFSIK